MNSICPLFHMNLFIIPIALPKINLFLDQTFDPKDTNISLETRKPLKSWTNSRFESLFDSDKFGICQRPKCQRNIETARFPCFSGLSDFSRRPRIRRLRGEMKIKPSSSYSDDSIVLNIPEGAALRDIFCRFTRAIIDCFYTLIELITRVRSGFFARARYLG